MNTASLDLRANPTRYKLFSVFFTARAYYPVLAILFTDLGIRLDQFVLLNLIWALTIFLFEVPSGALADTIGRRRLLIAASVLMTIEMLCLLMAPRDGGTLLFILCLINRICSGLSEACASGADEALAYDSLPEENRAQAWDQLLASVMRWRAAGFVVAMILGGVIYNPEPLNFVLPNSLAISTDISHRLPVLLVLCQALACLWVTYRMVEPLHPHQGAPIAHAFRLTLDAAKWVFNHRLIWRMLILGVVIDAIIRNFATVNSSYFRVIELPEWSYGFIGAGFGVLSWFVPGIATKLNERFSPLANMSILAFCAFVGLAAVIPAWPLAGLVPALFLMMLMGFLGFTLSRVLHNETDSSKRATVLSVKGLIFNLGYGLFSLTFSQLLLQFTNQTANQALISALKWQLPAFAITILVLLLWTKLTLQKTSPS